MFLGRITESFIYTFCEFFNGLLAIVLRPFPIATVSAFDHQTGRRHHEKTTSEIGWLSRDVLKRRDISPLR